MADTFPPAQRRATRKAHALLRRVSYGMPLSWVHMRDALIRLYTRLDRAEEEVRELRRMVGEVAACGVEFADPRIRYLTVQIDSKLWAELQAARKEQLNAPQS